MQKENELIDEYLNLNKQAHYLEISLNYATGDKLDEIKKDFESANLNLQKLREVLNADENKSVTYVTHQTLLKYFHELIKKLKNMSVGLKISIDQCTCLPYHLFSKIFNDCINILEFHSGGYGIPSIYCQYESNSNSLEKERLIKVLGEITEEMQSFKYGSYVDLYEFSKQIILKYFQELIQVLEIERKNDNN